VKIRKIKVTDLQGNLAGYLDLREEKERYRGFFKLPPSDVAILRFLDKKSALRLHEIEEFLPPKERPNIK